MANKRSVLITGCSDGGMGAELAKEFHKAGLHVYATARSVDKMAALTALGIETMPLDVLSDASIKACAARVPSLDILVNNAGAIYTMPLADAPLADAKALFDLNVWAPIAMTQTFLPVLLQSPKAIIANHSSVADISNVPSQGAYSASKAALTSLNNTLRLELAAFPNVSVVTLKTGAVKTNIGATRKAQNPTLPEGSVYAPAAAEVEYIMGLDWFSGGITAGAWARGTVGDLLAAGGPPREIWRGKQAWLVWAVGLFPSAWLESIIVRVTKWDKVVGKVKAARK